MRTFFILVIVSFSAVENQNSTTLSTSVAIGDNSTSTSLQVADNITINGMTTNRLVAGTINGTTMNSPVAGSINYTITSSPVAGSINYTITSSPVAAIDNVTTLNLPVTTNATNVSISEEFAENQPDARALTPTNSNGPDPKGDRLMSYQALARYQTIVCLASTTVDMKVNGEIIHKAGAVFRTQCNNEPEEIWIVKYDNGIKTYRPKSNQNYCLTLDANDKPVRVATCDVKETGQAIEEKPYTSNGLKTTISYKYIEHSLMEITGAKSKKSLLYDVKFNTMIKYPGSKHAAWAVTAWMWASGVEQRAKGVRDINFVFPIKGNANLNITSEDTVLGKQYLLGYMEQMMHSTKPYPKVTLTKDSCTAWSGVCDCNCFPIDYGLSPSDISLSQVELDVSIKTGGISESNPTVNRISTGMYAIPGTTVQLTVSPFNSSNITILAQLFLQPDVMLDVNNWRRPLGISVKEVLSPGLNKIRSPYGGALFLEVIGRNTKAKPVNVAIRAVPMANFVLGKTTEADWANQIKRKPNWITYRGVHIGALDLKAPFTSATHSEMVSMIKRLDLVMKNEFLLSGYDLNAKNIESLHAAPQGWMWWTRDIPGMNYGAHSGNPVIQPVFNNRDITLDFNKWDTWMWGHELGHNMQTSCYSSRYGGEVTNNIYSVFITAYICGDGKYVSKCGGSGGKDFIHVWNQTVGQSLAKGIGYFEGDINWMGLTFWIQIMKVYGFWTFRELNKIMREIKDNPKNSKYVNFCDKSKKEIQYDGPYEVLSDIVKEDLIAHFDAYKVPLSAEVKKRVADKKYPKPKVIISRTLIPIGDVLNWNVSGPQPDYALKSYKDMMK